MLVLLWGERRGGAWFALQFPHGSSFNGCQKVCYTHHRADLAKADIVLFDILALPPQPPNKRSGQLWIGLANETSAFSPILADQQYLRLTFGLDRIASRHPEWSEIPYSRALTAIFFPKPYSLEGFWGDSPRSRKQRVAAFCSHSVPARDNYLRQLMQHYPCDSFGKVANNCKLPQQKRFAYDHESYVEKIQTLSGYWYSFALENCPVPNDVSEKIFQALWAGSIPITDAIGAECFLPDTHCVIRVQDFSSAKALAQHLHWLDEHPEERERYLAWKSRAYDETRSPGFRTLYTLSQESWLHKAIQHGDNCPEFCACDSAPCVDILK